MHNQDIDIVVVGCGSAGAAVAWQLARRGMRVAVVERRGLDRAGARWRNAIPPWMFYAAGLAQPGPPEWRGGAEPITLISRDGRARFTLPTGPMVQVDMGLLIGRLQGLAEEAGATLLDHTSIVGVSLTSGRPTELTCVRQTPDGGAREFRLRARLFVDASGAAGALRERVPELARCCPAVRGDHICVAVQKICAVADRAGAEAFLRDNGAEPPVTLSWIGIDSGFSTLTVGLDAELRHVDLLAGSAGPGIDADAMMADFTGRETWTGAPILGGRGRIPLRHPYHRLACPGAVLIGDAACMVYSAHGSGVGYGLIAGRMLAEVIRTFDDPGSDEATWAYQARFQRRYGGVLAAADLFRRRVQHLGGAAVADLMAAGFVAPRSVLDGLEQRAPGVSPGTLAAVARGLVRTPGTTLKLAGVPARMARLQSLYSGYPDRPDIDALARWSQQVAALFEDARDVREGGP